MKTIMRFFQYSNRLKIRLLQFFAASVCSALFGAFNIILIIPMLNILFNNTEHAVPDLPDFNFSSDYLVGIFNHYLYLIVYKYGKVEALSFVCGLIVFFILMSSVFSFIEHVIATNMRTDLVKNLRLDLFKKITNLHIGFFYSQHKGDLISRFTNDIYAVEELMMKSLKALLREPVIIIVYFFVLFTLSFKLTLFTLLVLPITGGLLAQLIKKLKKQAIRNQESLSRIVTILDETFSGIRIIKAFNAKAFIVEKMEKESNYYKKFNRSMSYKNGLSSPISEVMGTIIVIVIILYGGNLVLENNESLSPDMLLGFLALFAMLIQPIKNLSNTITEMQRAKASFKRVFEFSYIQPAIQNKPDAIALKRFNEAIEFENVSFAYDSEMVLDNINLRLAKGKTMALVGASGGGKSTLVDLIPRFHDPSKGYVKIDGIPLTDYKIDSVRELIGVVSQESILFNDTVYNNIAFNNQHATEAEIIQASKIANAHEFISAMKHGYQTSIGEHGSKLSGGQKQRISIARALLKNPPILILDEATSALDMESEKLVQEALSELMKNRTSIVIAHRLSTIKDADEIVVINNGKIVEKGDHNALIIKEKGVYSKLIALQNRK